jgi:uncharacterized protein
VSDLFWENKGWENEDKHLIQLKKAPFRRDFPSLKLETGFYAIRGPRQIGKSSWLKTILQHNHKTKKCFYLSCENIRDHLDLAELFKSIRDRDIILLDEISFVKDWDRAVKHELDRGYSGTLIITGSHAADVRKGIDQMPGRWGAGRELNLLPMDFFEFQSVRKQAGWKIEDLSTELEKYFIVGGFPSAVIEAGEKAKMPKKSIETYRRWLVGDLLKLGKQETYLKELIYQIGKTTSSTVSLQTIAKKTNMGSHHTAQDYISLLQDCFAVGTLYAMDETNGDFKFKKEKKFYFRDPLIYWLSFEWSETNPPKNSFELIAEMVAFEHLNRKHQRFGYISNKSGEVDFFKPNEFAIEVKWQSIVTQLSNSYKNLRVPQKAVWNKSTFFKF